MIGKKTSVTTSMMNRVIWLEDASQTVKLATGLSELGSRNGNIDNPTEAMIPRIARLEPSNPMTPLRNSSPAHAAKVPTSASAGAVNAALLAASILATSDSALADRLEQHRSAQSASVAESPE